MPSGSFNAAGFLLYEATLNSGYCKNHETNKITRPDMYLW